MSCSNKNNEQKNSEVVIVMVPFPAQGHLNQLLHLSRLLAAYNLPIHYVGTTTHIRQAKLRLHGWDPLSVSNNVQFHEFEIPPFVSLSPDPTTPIAFPAHLQPLFDACTLLREPVGKLLRQLALDARRVVVINDSLSAYVVQDVETTPRAESYTFNSVSAFSIFFFIWDFFGLPVPINDDLVKDVPSNEDCFTPEFIELMHMEVKHAHFSSGSLYNACRAIEGKYINLLKEHDLAQNPNHWAIGPFNPVLINQTENEKSCHSCLDWLDKQAFNSVIFVSFGTTTSFKDKQIIEIALGLEQSGQKFIWVLRDADKGNVFDENVRKTKLPKGYEERIEGRGIVVRDWAPQLEILAHSATGGFLSHCGWNSCMESISCGVPIGTWPMHSDQPRNAILVTRVLKIGVTVRDWADRDKLVTASVVENGVRRLMVETEGVVEMRKRAAELGAAAKTAVAKGGISQMELDSFVAHITR